jgi:hypothetical protein
VKPRKTHGLGVDCVSMISKGQTTIKPLPAFIKMQCVPPPFPPLGHIQREERQDSFASRSSLQHPSATSSAMLVCDPGSRRHA